jgi:hypothetical protein
VCSYGYSQQGRNTCFKCNKGPKGSALAFGRILIMVLLVIACVGLARLHYKKRLAVQAALEAEQADLVPASSAHYLRQAPASKVAMKGGVQGSIRVLSRIGLRVFEKLRIPLVVFQVCTPCVFKHAQQLT